MAMGLDTFTTRAQYTGRRGCLKYSGNNAEVTQGSLSSLSRAGLAAVWEVRKFARKLLHSPRVA